MWAGGTNAKKSAKLGRMGSVCWLASLKRLGFWFQIIIFFGPHMPIIDNQKANLLEHLVPLGSPSRQPCMAAAAIWYLVFVCRVCKDQGLMVQD